MLRRLAESFANASPSLAIGGDGAANNSNGVDTLVAINALNYLAGNVGTAGGVVFNPNPAGATSHDHQANYRTLAQLATSARNGDIDVLILNDANPVFTMPIASEFKAALARIPFIVSLSSFMDETSALANVVLPLSLIHI